jgi:hypothetical protein
MHGIYAVHTRHIPKIGAPDANQFLISCIMIFWYDIIDHLFVSYEYDIVAV